MIVMQKNKMYKYIGHNGTILSRVLIDTPNKIELIELRANEGKILTNNIKKVYCTYILPEEIDEWYEIEDKGQKEIID